MNVTQFVNIHLLNFKFPNIFDNDSLKELTNVSVMTATFICPLTYSVGGACAVVDVVARGCNVGEKKLLSELKSSFSKWLFAYTSKRADIHWETNYNCIRCVWKESKKEVYF